MKNQKLLISSVSVIVFFLLFNYFLLTVVNLRYGGIYFYFAFIVVIIGLINLKLNGKFVIKNDTVRFVRNATVVDEDGKIIQNEGSNKVSITLFVIGGGLIVLLILFAIISSPLFFSDSYHDLIGEVEEKEYTADFSAVDTSQIPVVDSALAEKLGDKQLGSVIGLGSEFHVGEFHDLYVDGKPVAVAPLEYNGFFKWINNKSGTPGYIIVDKVSGDVELVDTYDGKDLKMKYMPSAFFSNDLNRHAYFNGHMTQGLADYALELDDNGYPYWVLTKINKNVGIIGGVDVMSVVVVDPQTGVIEEYTPANAPEWIDTIYPKEIVIKQLDDWGVYVNGFFNSILGQKDVIKTTDGSRRVFEDGVYHYTGLTSVGSDESTAGMAFINTRTKATTFYKMSGATENAAMDSAEGIVQNYGYSATFPIPLNVFDQATFLITLKDDKGLIKQYAFVNVTDFAKVGLGSSLSDAYFEYGEVIDSDDPINPGDVTTEITGNITYIANVIIESNSVYYFMIEGSNTVYEGRYSISRELPLSSVGDNVTISISDKHIVEFNNNDITSD